MAAPSRYWPYSGGTVLEQRPASETRPDGTPSRALLHATSRRRFLAGIGGAAFAAGFLAACGDERDTAPAATTAEPGTTIDTTTSTTAEASSPTTGFTFTDGRGVTVTLDRKPERIVAYAAPAAALWHLGVTPVGIFAGSPLSESANLADIDVTGIDTVGSVYGEIDLEKLVALEPDLVVTACSPRQGDLLWGFADLQVQEQVESVAPIVAINGIEDPTEVISQFEALATAMGADIEGPEYAAASQRFDTAVADLEDATAAKPGLTAVAVTSYDRQLYFAKPAAFPALRQMGTWGLTVVEPAGGDDFWETVSLEEANKYLADLILYDTQPVLDLEDLSNIGTWQSLPAVQSGQIVPWDKLENWSYAAYAADIEAITQGVKAADPDLVA
ncbi:MAG: ABC transporter substrate-binding protein [Dehalococcoidia bacterium]|nr:ABC transporter substrate-binding protein [Dehalococcoidia bacterium]